MAFIYPKNGSRISLSKNFDGKTNEVLLKLAHTQPKTEVFWYLDETFLRQTQNFHEIGISPSKGKHRIIAIDALGNEVSVRISME